MDEMDEVILIVLSGIVVLNASLYYTEPALTFWG